MIKHHRKSYHCMTQARAAQISMDRIAITVGSAWLFGMATVAALVV